jgi:DNA-binding IscR family transcriptional regulator
MTGGPLAAQGAPPSEETIEFFRQNCSSCHTIGGGRLAGPDLKDASKRRPRPWLREFIRDPKAVIDRGDPYAQKIFQAAGRVYMQQVPGITKRRWCTNPTRPPPSGSPGWRPAGHRARGIRAPTPPYAAKLCSRLKDAEYIRTRQGVSGGVALTKSARKASLLDLARDLGDPFVVSHCLLLRETCNTEDPYPMHSSWSTLHAEILDSLRGIRAVADPACAASPRKRSKASRERK